MASSGRHISLCPYYGGYSLAAERLVSDQLQQVRVVPVCDPLLIRYLLVTVCHLQDTGIRQSSLVRHG